MRIRSVLCAVLAATLTGFSGAGAAEGEAKPEVTRGETVSGEMNHGSGAEDGSRPSMDWLEEKGLTLGESSLAYPALKEGTVAEELREIINERILEDGHLREYTTRISQLISGGSLHISWRGTILGEVLSFSVFAEGAVDSPRATWVWTGGNIDLRDGHEVTLEEIFQDPAAARKRMEEYLEFEVAPELSAHLMNSALTPLPELFGLTERGIVWKYDIAQLSTLSDRAGDVLIPWAVIRDQLILGEGSLLRAMELEDWIVPLAEDTREETRDRELALILAMTSDGAIPGIPATLGEGLQALTETWRMLIDPDLYASSRMFSLEGAAFRDVFLLTDYLSEGWDSSVVDGIRVDLGSVYGLSIGETTQAAWRLALGEPEHSIVFDAEQAELYRTVPGSRDYYEFGGHRLQLHADEDGVLSSVILSE